MAEAGRERWSSRFTFIFAAIGSAIGLGNVWRFPYMSYSYGGGAFLVAWFMDRVQEVTDVVFVVDA